MQSGRAVANEAVVGVRASEELHANPLLFTFGDETAEVRVILWPTLNALQAA